MKKYFKTTISSKHSVLVILLIIYVISLLIVLFNSDQLHDWEECSFGVIAKEIMENRALPLMDYTHNNYQGSILEGFAIVPFFFLLGFSGITLKLGNLLFLIPMFVLTYYFLDRFFNRTAAITTSVLFIFAFPTFIVHSLNISLYYLHSFLFTIAALFILLEIFYKHKKKPKYFIFLGLISGIGLWHSYVFLITIILILICWFSFDKKFFTKKTFLFFVIFFLIGLSPWIYYNTTHSFAGLSQLDEGLYSTSQNRISSGGIKLVNLFSYDLPNSFMFPNIISHTGNIFNYLYYTIFVCSLIGIIYYCRKGIAYFVVNLFTLKRIKPQSDRISKETIILLYLALFLLAYALSKYRVLTALIDIPLQGMKGYRYLDPLYPIIFIIISLFISRLWKNRNQFLKIISLVIIIILIFAGLMGMIDLIPEGKSFTSYQAYCYELLPSNIGWKFSHNPVKGIELCNKLNSSEKTNMYVTTCYEKIGEGIDWRFRNDPNFAIQECNKLKKVYWSYCYTGIGEGIAWRNNFHIETIKYECASLGPEYYAPCVKGALKKIG